MKHLRWALFALLVIVGLVAGGHFAVGGSPAATIVVDDSANPLPAPALQVEPDSDGDSFSTASMTVIMQNPGGAAGACPTGSMPVWADCVEDYLGTDPFNGCDPPPDVTGGGLISGADVFAIFPSWLLTQSSPSWTARVDLNADGVVSGSDVFLIFPFWLTLCP